MKLLDTTHQIFSQAKARGVHVFKHACGNNWKLLDMFVEAGYEAYQSIQESASMDLARVKAEYGDKLLLWGGVSVEKLMSGEPDDVRRDAEHALEMGSPGGGYVFGTSHSVAVGTKYENFMVMLDTFHELANKAAENAFVDRNVVIH